MRIFFSLTFLFLFFAKGMAQSDFQPGYIITSSKDTVRGFVQNVPGDGRDRKVEFKISEASSVNVYDADMIAGFGYAEIDRYFASFELPPENRKIFAEMLLNGRADLYIYDELFYIQKDLERERIDKEVMRESSQGGSRYVYAHKTYIGILNRYFSDCLPARLLRGEVEYREKDFVDVFRKYSECSGAAYHVYKAGRQKKPLAWHVLVGLNNSSVRFKKTDLDIFENDNSFFFGGGIIVPFNRIGENVFVTAEATYNRNTYHGKKEGFTPSGTVAKDYILEMTLVRIPVGLKVELSKRSFRPYLRGGLTPFFPLTANWSIRYQGATEAEFDIKEKTASLVYWGGLGFQGKIGSSTVFAELRLEKFVDFIGFYGPAGASNIPSNVTNKMLVFGFNF